MRPVLAALLLALPGVAMAEPEYRRYLCRSGIDLAVAAIPGPGGAVLVMAPEGRQLIMLPAQSDAPGVTLHVELPDFAQPSGLYLWRERQKTPDELADPSGLAWVVDLAWRSNGSESLIDRCRRLPS